MTDDERPVEPAREVVELVGHVLWDIFSDNHTVLDAGGEFGLGSFRGTAGFLADEIDRRYPALGGAHDYMDFYMGTIWIRDRADLTPVYRWAFAALRRADCDWRYSFPRLYLLSFDAPPEPAEVAEMRRQIDADYDEAVEAAARQPPPPIVRAYRDVYGEWPRGWPPAPL